MKTALVALFVLAAVGCSQPNAGSASRADSSTPPTRAPNAHAQTSPAPATAVSQSGSSPAAATASRNNHSAWSFSLVNSSMDGTVARAVRTYPLSSASGDGGAIQAVLECSQGARGLTLKFVSTVGDPDHPSKASAFVFSSTPAIVHSRQVQYGTELSGNEAGEPLYRTVTSTTGGHNHLTGRIKFRSGQPQDISSAGGPYVSVGDYANVAVADLPQWALVGLADWAYEKLGAVQDSNYLAQISVDFSFGDHFNKVAAVKYALPAVVELNNGTGIHDLVVDDSPAVENVLDRCGASGSIASASQLARFAQTLPVASARSGSTSN